MFENKKEEVKTDGNIDLTQDLPENRLDQLKSLVESVHHNLDKITRIVDKIQQDQKKEMYKKMPGIEGEFDGVYLVAEDGSKHEVPANYAAKSRLVFGDKLKIVEENGKKVFKQIQKVERKEVKGVLSKKEGKWYLLTDSGTYKISDIAAEFNQVKLNEKAIGLIPENKPNSPYAALDRMDSTANVKSEEFSEIKKSEQKSEQKRAAATQSVIEKKEKENEKQPVKEKIEQKPQERKKTPFVKPTGSGNSKSEVKKPQAGKPLINRPVIKPPVKPIQNVKEQVKESQDANKEYVAGILEDDDLR